MRDSDRCEVRMRPPGFLHAPASRLPYGLTKSRLETSVDRSHSYCDSLRTACSHSSDFCVSKYSMIQAGGVASKPAGGLVLFVVCEHSRAAKISSPMATHVRFRLNNRRSIRYLCLASYKINNNNYQQHDCPYNAFFR